MFNSTLLSKMASFFGVVFISFISSCLAAKYAMFPMFSRSHYLVIAGLGEELAARGHEIEIFVGDTETYAHKVATSRVFKTSQALKNGFQQVHAALSKSSNTVVELSGLASIQAIYCDDLLSNIEAMKAVGSADVIIGDSLYMCGSLIAANFSLPFVTVFTNSLSTPTAHAFGLTLDPAYVPQFKSALSANLHFVARVKNLYHWAATYIAFYYGTAPRFQELKDRYQIASNKSLYEILSGVDLIIGQMGFFLDHPRPILPNTRVVGPLLTSPSQPLPAELEEFMQSSGNDGVILVAFGTTLGNLDESILRVMAKAFGQLQQKFIWKLTEAEASSIALSQNIKVLSWLPQNDILGHPKTRLFIGHAGLNGMLESIYHGVPMVCSPFFGDQFDNAHAAKYAGFAEVLNLKSSTVEELVSVIYTVITDPSYRESATRISKSIKMLPRTPVQEAADWVEYTQALGGLQYLRPRGLDLPFYQFYLLDILLVAVMTAIVFSFSVKFIFKFTMSLFSPRKKEKAS